MERFIGFCLGVPYIKKIEFKIQYGEIYRTVFVASLSSAEIFKIQYGEIYSK